MSLSKAIAFSQICVLAAFGGGPALQVARDIQFGKPTEVQIENITDRDRSHSQLFHGPDHSKPLDELDGEKPEIVIVQGRGTPVVSPQPISKMAALHKISCKADVIVAGIPRVRRSNITSDRRWVFSEFSVDVTEVLLAKDQTIPIPKVISLLRSGGLITLKGRVIDARSADGHLRLDQTYIFFLNRISKSNAFKTVASDTSVLSIEEGKVFRQRANPDATFDGMAYESFKELLNSTWNCESN